MCAHCETGMDDSELIALIGSMYHMYVVGTSNRFKLSYHLPKDYCIKDSAMIKRTFEVGNPA